MAQDSPSEDDVAPVTSATGLLLPALLCGVILALGLVSVTSRAPREGDSRAERGAAISLSTPAKPGLRLLVFETASARSLAAILDAAWSSPGAEDAVPNLAPLRLPPDMDELDRETKKDAFLRAVLPHVLASNRKIRVQRARLREVREKVLSGRVPSPEQDAFLSGLAEQYRVDVGGSELAALGSHALVEELWSRADVVPPSLALAQAAIESAWGGSRFARLGNSLFGQWVFSADKGIAPLFRDEGANYSVARFVDLAEAVEAYLHNLNSFWAYEEFRALRRGLREAGRSLDPKVLAEGLRLYSARRDEYVEEVRSVLRDNRLDRFDGRRMADVPESVWDRVLADVDGGLSFDSVYLPD